LGAAKEFENRNKKMTMHRLLFIIAFTLAAYGITRAQNFNYSVTADSVAWNELNAQTILNSNNSAWNFDYKIPIGFTYNFCGRNFDSLTIETNGYIVFDSDRNYALTAFSGVGDRTDAQGNHAIISYELSGTSGNHILKIQYLNCSPNSTGEEVQSWQVWLKENGDAEVRVGPGTLRTNSYQSIAFNEITLEEDTTTTIELDSTQLYRIGLLNMNMNSEDRGLFVSGDPSSPQTAEVNENNPETPHLSFIPVAGYRYTFSQL
jgi:hypothetical protein